MIKISVIVPVYNVKDYLNRCVKSILEQTYSEFELILIDDGSTDGSSTLCDDWVAKDNRVSVIHKDNRGLGFARNTGIEHSQGEYLIFIDSDDYIEPNMLEGLVIDSNLGEADVCYSDYFRDYNDRIVENRHLQNLGGKYGRNDIISKIIPWMIGGSPTDHYDDIMGWGVWKSIYKREIIEKYGILFHSESEFISEDIIFQLDFLTHANIVTISEIAYYHYCLRDESLSTKYRENRREKNYQLYCAQIERLKKLNIEKDNKIRADRLLIASARVNVMLAVKSLTFKEALRIIRAYESDVRYMEVIKNYPISYLPRNQKIFLQLLKSEMNWVLYVITYIYIKRKYKGE